MRALNLGTGKVTKVPKLTESKAVEQGAEILSEFIIISIASGILIYEYNRSKEKDDAKEEKQKKSLKRLLGKPVDVPQELIKTVEEIPEIPNEVKPMELLDDKKAKEGEGETTNTKKIAVPADNGPSIKEIVEQHYTKPQVIVNQVDNKVDEEKSQNYNNPGVIMESVNHVMKHLFRTDEVKSDLTKSSNVGIVTGALEDYFKEAKN